MQNTMLDSTISNSLQLFADKGFKIRVIMRCSEPWFVAKDVASCIEHKDVTTMCRVCRDKDKVVVNYAELKHSADLAECFSEQQSPNLTLISESGLYRILAKCNLPKCEPFESWVFDEVLPSIRKTGSSTITKQKRGDGLHIQSPQAVIQSGSGMTNKPLHNRSNTMQNTMLDSTISCIPSTEIQVYEDYLDAPPISGVYVFEVEKGIVKCGMSGNVKKRFRNLVDIKKHREASLHGRAAVLPVDSERLKRVESAFFSLLSGNVEGTELFKISFERALKALRRLYENNPPSMFHLTDEEKAEENLKQLKAEKVLKNALGLDVSVIRQKHAYYRACNEISISGIFSSFLELFPESVDKLSYERIRNEYRHYLHLVWILLSPKVWEEDFGRLQLDEVTAGRIGALALRLNHVVFSYKDVLNSSAHPRHLVYHAANLVLLLEDIRTLFSELVEVDEKCDGKYPDWVLHQFKEVRDSADYFILYLLSRFTVTCAYHEQDVSRWRENLHLMGERLHELFKEEMRTVG